MKKKIFNLISLIFNILIVLFTVVSVISFFTNGGKGNMEVVGYECFKYFTVDSNILCAISSLLIIVYNIKNIKNKIYEFSDFSVIFKLVGVTAVSITFITVMAFLGPLTSYKFMLEGVNLFLHLINPLLAIISFIIFELDKKIEFMNVFYGVLPTFIYEIVYVLNVLIFKNWEDFYMFTRNGMTPFFIIGMPVFTYLFAIIINIIRNIFLKNMGDRNESL